MDPWKGISETKQSEVYVGAWRNWSRASVAGWTLTLTERDGNILIAFAALFLTLVSTRLWKIACLCLHRFYSTPHARDTLHHQRQVILRNSPSPHAGLLTFLDLARTAPKGSDVVYKKHRFLRIMPMVLLAIVFVAVFSVATYFLPSIADTMGDEVLLVPRNCGIIDYERVAKENYKLYTGRGLAHVSNQVANADNYAQQCYSNNTGSLNCAGFVVDRIPSVMNRNADCPFNETICRNNTNGLYLSTGMIDSNDFLGMNRPYNERAMFNMSLHCSPIKTEGYSSSIQFAEKNLTRYHYGPNTMKYGNETLMETRGTIEVESSEMQNSRSPDAGEYLTEKGKYRLNIHYVPLKNRSIDNGSATFLPIPELFRDDGDLLLAFLSGDGVRFTDTATDDWYGATEPAASLMSAALKNPIPAYAMRDAASPLGCVEKYQFCHRAIAGETICGPAGSASDAWSGALSLTSSETVISEITWLANTVVNIHVREILEVLGPQALASRHSLYAGVQSALPDNQWQLDVMHWWATYLAVIQEAPVQATLGPPDEQIAKYVTAPPSDEKESDAGKSSICHNQKIRRAGYMNFSLFGVCFLFAGGGLIVCLSFAVEPALALLHRRHGFRPYPYLEWVTHESLQLHRLAHEERGWGTWSGATRAVPTTLRHETLGSLDVGRRDHPKLTSTFYVRGDGYAVPKGDDVSSTDSRVTA